MVDWGRQIYILLALSNFSWVIIYMKKVKNLMSFYFDKRFCYFVFLLDILSFQENFPAQYYKWKWDLVASNVDF